MKMTRTVITMLLRTKGIHTVGDSEYEESEETKTWVSHKFDDEVWI